MNNINNFNYTNCCYLNSELEKINCRGKTLNLKRSKATLEQKLGRIKRSRQNIQIYANRATENKINCQTFRFNELARPKIERVKSILERQRQKSKFDMLKAEKFVKIIQNSNYSPEDVKKCLDERKRQRDAKNRKIKNVVDNFHENFKSCKFAQISFTDQNRKNATNILQKLTHRDEGKKCKAPTRQKCKTLADQKVLSIDEYVTLREKGNLPDKIYYDSSSSEKENSICKNSLSKKSPPIEQVAEKLDLKSVTEIVIEDPQVDARLQIAPINSSIPSIKVSDDSNQKSITKIVENSEKVMSADDNNTALLYSTILRTKSNFHQPSFAKHFPVKNFKPKVSHVIDEKITQNLPSSDILNQNESSFNNFLSNESSTSSFTSVIALRDLTIDDLKFCCDLDNLIQVSNENFNKIYVGRVLESEESLKKFCQTSLSRRSKLFKVNNSQAAAVSVKKMKNCKSMRGSEERDDKNSFLHISDGTHFSIQKLSQACENIFSPSINIQVIRNSADKFSVIKK